jgi:hypothetical protein
VHGAPWDRPWDRRGTEVADLLTLSDAD